MPRVAPRTDRRAGILDAAIVCFAKHGVGNTTIAEIRAVSGASVGSIYHHFGDKDGIAGRVYLEVLQRYHDSYLEALDACTSGEAAVKTTVLHYFEWVAAHHDAARLLLEARQSPQVAESEKEIRAATRRFLALVHARLARFVASAEMRELSPAVLTALLAAPCAALAAAWVRGPRPKDAAEQSNALAEAVLRAVRAESATGSTTTMEAKRRTAASRRTRK
jgi:AcrR family transcriptional regulator